jgi:hypothetical protein
MRRCRKGWIVMPLAHIKVRRFSPVLRSCGLIGYFAIVPAIIAASELRHSRVGPVSLFCHLQPSSFNIHHTLQPHLPTARVLSPLGSSTLSPTLRTGENFNHVTFNDSVQLPTPLKRCSDALIERLRTIRIWRALIHIKSIPFRRQFIQRQHPVRKTSCHVTASRAHGYPHYTPFLKYLHEVHATLSLFVGLPLFIGLETVVNRIKI